MGNRLIGRFRRTKAAVPEHVVSTEIDHDLNKWLVSDRVIVLDAGPAERWLGGQDSFDVYFAGAVEKAQIEARADVDEALSHH